MECKQCHELISLYIDGELGILDEENLHRHLEVCNDCNIYMKNMLYLSANIKKSYNINVSNIDFSKDIMSRIKAKRAKRKIVPLFRKDVANTNLIKRSVGVALVLIIFMLFTYFINSHFNSNKTNIENLVIQHLDNPFMQDFPNIENVNILQ